MLGRRRPRRGLLQVSGCQVIKVSSRMKVVGLEGKGQMQEVFCKNRTVWGARWSWETRKRKMAETPGRFQDQRNEAS